MRNSYIWFCWCRCVSAKRVWNSWSWSHRRGSVSTSLRKADSPSEPSSSLPAVADFRWRHRSTFDGGGLGREFDGPGARHPRPRRRTTHRQQRSTPPGVDAARLPVPGCVRATAGARRGDRATNDRFRSTKLPVSSSATAVGWWRHFRRRWELASGKLCLLFVEKMLSVITIVY